jgi:hypothetical protein
MFTLTPSDKLVHVLIRLEGKTFERFEAKGQKVVRSATILVQRHVIIVEQAG